MNKHVFVVVVSVVLASCSGGASNPTAPTAPIAVVAPVPAPVPTPAPAPTPSTYTVAGVVRDATTGAGVSGVAVRIAEGTGARQTTTTDGNGYYSIPGVAGSIIVSGTRAGYDPFDRSTVVSGGDARFDIAMNRTAPPWSRSGVGNTVFDMPSTVRRVRIIGTYTARGSNFVVWVGGRLIVNEIIGTAYTGGTRYEGLHSVTGGQVDITNSRDVVWSITQEQ